MDKKPPQEAFAVITVLKGNERELEMNTKKKSMPIGNSNERESKNVI